MPPEKLYLVNRTHQGLAISLDLPISCAASTLNKSKFRNAEVFVRPHNSLELCAELGLPKDKIKAVLASSADVQFFVSTKKLKISDPAEVRIVKPAPSFTAQDPEPKPMAFSEAPASESIVNIAPEVVVQLEAAPKKKKSSVKPGLVVHCVPPTIDLYRAELKQKNDGLSPAEMAEARKAIASSNGEDVEASTSSSAPADGLDVSTKVVIADSVPSTKWTLEAIQAYATKKGIKTEGLSRNMLLRKIREAS